MSINEFRAYLKPSGSNREVGSAYYELASEVMIMGVSNCEILSLNFERCRYHSNLIFRPFDWSKPVVFAVDGGGGGCIFFAVDAHKVEEHTDGGMFNYKPFTSDEYLVDGSKQLPSYWSITSCGMTFVYGDQSYPDAWNLPDCDSLCAFIAGELSVDQLHARAEAVERRTQEKESRQKKIERYRVKLAEARKEYDRLVLDSTQMWRRQTQMIEELRRATSGSMPFVKKSRIRKYIQ